MKNKIRKKGTAQTNKTKHAHSLSHATIQSKSRAFQMNDEFFRQLTDSLEDYAIFTTDKEGCVRSWNSGAEKLLGYKEKEIIGKNASVLFTPEDLKKEKNLQELETAVKKGRAQDEKWHVKKDKTRFWGSGLVFPLKNGSGRLIGFTKIMRDLTMSKQISEAQSRLAAIIESSDDAIISKTLQGIITSWNKSAEKLFGHSAREAVGQHISLIIPPERIQEEAMILSKIRKGEHIDHFETMRMNKKGKRIPISVTISPIKMVLEKLLAPPKLPVTLLKIEK